MPWSNRKIPQHVGTVVDQFERRSVMLMSLYNLKWLKLHIWQSVVMSKQQKFYQPELKLNSDIVCWNGCMEHTNLYPSSWRILVHFHFMSSYFYHKPTNKCCNNINNFGRLCLCHEARGALKWHGSTVKNTMYLMHFCLIHHCLLHKSKCWLHNRFEVRNWLHNKNSYVKGNNVPNM